MIRIWLKLYQSCGFPMRIHKAVFSVTLFLVAVNGLVSVLPPGIRLSLYIDDLAIIASGPFIPALHQTRESDGDKISLFLDSQLWVSIFYLLKLFHHFSPSCIGPQHLFLCDAHPIPPFKFLGIIFDKTILVRSYPF